MFRLYSKGCEYAIRALIHMAPTDDKQRFQAKEICKKADIPESFTRKIFQDLVSGGLLDAIPGPGGGYSIVKDVKEISLLEVIETVDGKNTFSGCILGLSECNAIKPCPLHHAWALAKEELLGQLAGQTLQDLVDTTRNRNAKLKTH
ncbi:MAG: transcriptional regulator [Candidatus Hydrogenedentota bacterium]|nr:MAG: transcriptional regulator [Candidatus Hydrogenedentota bacterium]